MPDYDNNLRGVLFPNDKAKDTQPDYKGSCEIDGVEYWVSGWKKLSKSQKPFMSLSFQAKDPVTDTKQNTPTNTDDEPINLNSIPF